MNIDIPGICQQLRKSIPFSLNKSNNLATNIIPGFYAKAQRHGFFGAIFETCPEIEKTFDETTALFLRSKKFDSQAMSYLTEEIRKDAELAQDLTLINYDSDTESKLSDILYIHNVVNNRGNFIYNKKTDICLLHHEPMITNRLKMKLGDLYAEWILANTKDCITRPVFMEPERIVEAPGSTHKVFNTWSKPDWFELLKENEGFTEATYETLPELVREFFDIFFLTKESRDWFLHWARDALFARSEVMCVFVAEKGTGKTVMVEEFLSGLFGKDNLLPIGEGFTQNHFQDGIQHNQLLFFDEFEVKKKIKNKLKRLLNARGVLEAKTVQAGAPVEFQFSMVMCSNNWLEFELDINDRRFCPLDITNTPLKKLWPQNKIEELCEIFRDPGFQFDMVSYLHTLPPGKSNTPLPTKIFTEICFNTLPDYLQRFIEYCKVHKKFTKTDFYRRQPGKRVGESTLKREVLNYKQMTGKVIASIRKHPEYEWVATSHTYDPALVAELDNQGDEEEEEERL